MAKYKIVINFICAAIMIVSFFHFFLILNNMNEKEMEIVHLPRSITRINGIQCDMSGNLYIGCIENSSIQVFRPSGEFLYGIVIPTNGGSFDFGFIGTELHVLARRTHLHMTFGENRFLDTQEISSDEYESLLSAVRESTGRRNINTMDEIP